MANQDFKVFRDQVFRLYDQTAYDEALALINEQAGQFTEQEGDLYFWRACLACRAGDPDGGLAWLRAAGDRGYWYHESTLQDPDLAPLQVLDQLKPLLAVFKERHAAAQANARPQLKTWSPACAAQGLLLALHGMGGNIDSEEERAHWLPAVEAGWTVSLAQSSQVWAPGKYFWQDRGIAMAELAAHLAALQAPEKTVLAGFSMGAGLAIQAVLGGTLGVNRFLAVAPAIRLESALPLLQTCSREVTGCIVIGEQDRFSPAALELAKAMKQAGLRCELELHPDLAHDFPPDFPTGLGRRLNAL